MDEKIRKIIENKCPDMDIDAISDIVNDVAEVIKEAVSCLINLANDLYSSIFKAITGRGRVVYLALHAKKARTRKKNMNRIIKTVLKENERTMKLFD